MLEDTCGVRIVLNLYHNPHHDCPWFVQTPSVVSATSLAGMARLYKRCYVGFPPVVRPVKGQGLSRRPATPGCGPHDKNPNCCIHPLVLMSTPLGGTVDASRRPAILSVIKQYVAVCLNKQRLRVKLQQDAWHGRHTNLVGGTTNPSTYSSQEKRVTWTLTDVGVYGSSYNNQKTMFDESTIV